MSSRHWVRTRQTARPMECPTMAGMGMGSHHRHLLLSAAPGMHLPLPPMASQVFVFLTPNEKTCRSPHRIVQITFSVARNFSLSQMSVLQVHEHQLLACRRACAGQLSALGRTSGALGWRPPTCPWPWWLRAPSSRTVPNGKAAIRTALHAAPSPWVSSNLCPPAVRLFLGWAVPEEHFMCGCARSSPGCLDYTPGGREHLRLPHDVCQNICAALKRHNGVQIHGLPTPAATTPTARSAPAS